jgi:hypothetical protein
LQCIFFLISLKILLLGYKNIENGLDIMCGRTVPSFRPALEHEIESWKDFRRALRPEEQKVFDKLMNYARIHADAGSLAARPLLSEMLFISFAIEQSKKIEHLEVRMTNLEEIVRKRLNIEID